MELVNLVREEVSIRLIVGCCVYVTGVFNRELCCIVIV